MRLLKNCMGTWLVQELRRAWRNEDGRETGWKDLDRMTLEAAPFQALIDPDDASFYNPANMQSAMEAFCRKTGQAAPTTRGGYLRMVYESLALKYRMINEAIQTVTGKTNRVVHIVGGGSKNVMLNQYVADALGLPVIAGPEEATAVGNCMVQALGLGVIGSLHEALPLIRRSFPIREYKPVETATWSRAYEAFRKIVR